MRPSSPLHVTIAGFGGWRVTVSLLIASVIASVAAWLLNLHADAVWGGPWGTDIAKWLAGMLTVVCVGNAATLLAMSPASLRWDSQIWHFGAPGSVGDEPERGQLRVAIDLGGWMLLRFDPERVSWVGHAGLVGRVLGTRWIPVQKSDIGQAWHVLRCTVYSPRPIAVDPLDERALHPDRRSRPAK